MLKLIGCGTRAVVLAVLMAASTTAIAGHTLNVSTSLSPDDPVFKGLQQFKKSVESRSDGKVKIRLFSSGQLGADNELLQHAQSGSNVGVVVDGARLSSFVPELALLPAPFVFPDYAAQKKFVSSAIFQGWQQKLTEKSGLTALSFNWYQGARMLVTQKKITTPADLHGVKVRALEAPVTIEAIKCLGGEPTPLSWSEIYSSIQTGIVNAAEAQPTAIYGSKLFEITKYITKTNHIYLTTGIIVSQKWLDTLPPDLQSLLREEAQKQGEVASQNVLAVEDSLLQEMAKQGVTVEEVDRAPFQKACAYVPGKMHLQTAWQQVQDVINESSH